MSAVRAIKALQVRDVDVAGQEHAVQASLQYGSVIIAPTHLADLDMPMTLYTLGSMLDILITNMAPQHSFRRNPTMNLLLRLAGKRNFLPIDYIDGRPAKGRFNPLNFLPMAEVLAAGRSVMIAAHKPMFVPELPDHAGIGAVYLASITGIPVIPVAVRLSSGGAVGYNNSILTTLFTQPSAKVRIGAPIVFEKIQPTSSDTGSPELVAIMRERSGTLHHEIESLLNRAR